MELRSHDVPADDGLTLNCWERSPADADEAVLFVHGVVTNARALFVTPVEGDTSYSWLHAASDLGRAAFAMDQRGYGDSDVPAVMDEPPEGRDPPTRADQAADDIAAVVDWIREDYDTVHLVGVSWGSHTTGRYLERDDPPVASLVHCAPVYEPAYDFETGLDALSIPDADRAWFEQDRETVRARSDHDPEVFDAIWRAQVESNQGVDDDTYVAQAGGIADWRESVRGDPVWDPANIDVPTMVFYGTDDTLADRQGSLACFDRLPVDKAEYVEMAGVDHYMMHGERRQEVFRLVSDFQDRVA
ncbi:MULTISPECIES: alpha/beta hydrolase [Salinibaculum]|uniref:alpha/beta hydrolase n=1 Tax=Salinibaculum TaxID=2732368 RepID=UPI0030CE8FCA